MCFIMICQTHFFDFFFSILKFALSLHLCDSDDRSLTEVFKLFDLIHILTTDHETVTRITKEVLY